MNTKSYDIAILDSGFNSTTYDINPVSQRGIDLIERTFGKGVCATTIRKSGLFDFVVFIETNGCEYKII